MLTAAIRKRTSYSASIVKTLSWEKLEKQRIDLDGPDSRKQLLSQECYDICKLLVLTHFLVTANVSFRVHLHLHITRRKEFVVCFQTGCSKKKAYQFSLSSQAVRVDDEDVFFSFWSLSALKAVSQDDISNVFGNYDVCNNIDNIIGNLSGSDTSDARELSDDY